MNTEARWKIFHSLKCERLQLQINAQTARWWLYTYYRNGIQPQLETAAKALSHCGKQQMDRFECNLNFHFVSLLFIASESEVSSKGY